jgi:hypothetical protein
MPVMLELVESYKETVTVLADTKDARVHPIKLGNPATFSAWGSVWVAGVKHVSLVEKSQCVTLQ